MDRLDFCLLSELCKDPLATHEALARSIQRSTSTVRKRLAALTGQRVFRGFDAKPAAEALGLTGTGAGWAVRMPLDAVLAVEGTIWVADTMDGQTAALGYATRPQEWLDAVSRVAGKPPFLVAPVDPYRGPTLGPLDLRILRALVDAPTAPAETVAGLCGLSAKTVRTRRAALLQTRAIRIEPVIRPDRTGAIAFYVYVNCDRARIPAVVDALQEAFLFSDDGGSACLLARASSLREKAERLAAVRALGVEPVEIVQNQDAILNRAAIVAMIDSALAPWRGPPERPRRKTPPARVVAVRKSTPTLLDPLMGRP